MMTGHPGTAHPSNGELADLFAIVAGYLALEGESTYRILAYEKAADLFRRHPVSIADLAVKGGLRGLPGVGAAIEAKVLEFLETGDISLLTRLRGHYPQGVLEVMRLPGVGPRTARRLWDEAGIGSLDDLRSACHEGRVCSLPGMGEKTQAKLSRALEVHATTSTGPHEPARLLLTEVRPQAESLRDALRASPEVTSADCAGSIRRCQSTVRDIDLVVSSKRPGPVMDSFSTLAQVAHIDQRGDTKLVAITHTGLNVDLRVVAPESYGNLLQHLTGSAAHNVALRGYAQRRGLKISEYGIDGAASGKTVTCATEVEVYGTLGLDYIPPELREDQGEIQAAASHTLPRLIERSQLRGDLHVHSNWTDGKATIDEMAEAAQQAGLEYLCFCDHSQALAMTGGLDPGRLGAQIEAIRELDARLDIKVLAGIEVDILLDGRLDLPDDVLGRLDFVTASIHSGFRQSRKEIMKRLLSALRSPHVDSIAHLSGRLINRREGYALDLETIARVAAETGCVRQVVQKQNHGMQVVFRDVFFLGRLLHLSQEFSFVLRQQLHVEIAVLLQPAFMSLDGQSPDEAKTALSVGEDPHHPGAAFDLFV